MNLTIINLKSNMKCFIVYLSTGISKCVVIKSYHSLSRYYTPKKVCNITKKNSLKIIILSSNIFLRTVFKLKKNTYIS